MQVEPNAVVFGTDIVADREWHKAVLPCIKECAILSLYTNDDKTFFPINQVAYMIVIKQMVIAGGGHQIGVYMKSIIPQQPIG